MQMAYKPTLGWLYIHMCVGPKRDRPISYNNANGPSSMVAAPLALVQTCSFRTHKLHTDIYASNISTQLSLAEYTLIILTQLINHSGPIIYPRMKHISTIAALTVNLVSLWNLICVKHHNVSVQSTNGISHMTDYLSTANPCSGSTWS